MQCDVIDKKLTYSLVPGILKWEYWLINSLESLSKDAFALAVSHGEYSP